jgi:tetratricopeptide (TPR) repeat protein
MRAQKNGNHAQAIADYQAAVRNDPAYYDAYYNLGLAALEKGDSPLSLWAYEIALALRPDSEDARYIFRPWPLCPGGYWFDAVEELQRISAPLPVVPVRTWSPGQSLFPAIAATAPGPETL